MHQNDDQPTDTDRDRDIRLSAEVLGQLDDEQRGLLDADLQSNPTMRKQREELRVVVDALSHQHAAESSPTPSLELRDAIQARMEGEVFLPNQPAKPTKERVQWSRRRIGVTLAITACLLAILAIPIGQALRTQQSHNEVALAKKLVLEQRVVVPSAMELSDEAVLVDRGAEVVLTAPLPKYFDVGNSANNNNGVVDTRLTTESLSATRLYSALHGKTTASAVDSSQRGAKGVDLYGTTMGMGNSDTLNDMSMANRHGRSMGVGDRRGVQSNGWRFKAIQSGRTEITRYWMESGNGQVVPDDGLPSNDYVFFDTYGESTRELRYGRDRTRGEYQDGRWYYQSPPANQGQYESIVENPFVRVVNHQALSTFSIDVDTASYANVRRFLMQNQLPPANAVRVEELINYFSYDYPSPEDKQPFATHLEVSECPWQPKHRLVRIGLQGKTIARQERPGCNLVFLLDVSGSMKDSNKLPLLKQAMKMLVGQLNENDRVSIVTYASQAGVRLKSTVADQHNVIRAAIDSLNASGSTNGGAGIQMACDQALEGAIEGGVNRVILATDGDLNVGITDDDALIHLIKEKAASDVFLTVLGFGEGNLKDAKLGKLADNGNGVYAFIDNRREARKVLIEQVEGSLVTIAKDVKIKIEFNPVEVKAYRLIGYENRLMTAAEFDDDKTDAGEIGSEHSVTAIYEIVPAAPAQMADAGSLKYQKTAFETLKYQQIVAPAIPDEELTDAAKSGELLTLSLRYKLPDSDESTLVEFPLLNSRKRFSEASSDFRFASAVASYGMLLRDSVYRGDTSFAAVEEIASAAIGEDEKGYRTEFLDLVRRAATMK